MTAISAVLFDLDGTLLDTANDLGKALNTLLSKHGLPQLPFSRIRPEAGRGSRGLIKVGFNIDENDARYTELCDALLALYEDYLLHSTHLFPGMEEVLTHLENKGIPWGIVTNKPEKFTKEIVKGLNLSERAQCIISGDTLPQRKPHPDPVLHACKLLNQDPATCLYVGDSEVDIIASRAAGTASLVALYGYIPAVENPSTWNADGYIQQPIDIIRWLD